MGSLLYNFSTVNKSVTKDYTFKDLALDVYQTQNNRDVKASLDFSAVQNGIENMFLFLPGERVLLPSFGNNLYKYVYEPINDITAGRLREEVIKMFSDWEPRVNIVDIRVIPDEDHNLYHVVIQYSVPSLGKRNILNWNKSINMRR
jgi:phage baseplate assembly protein W